MAGSREVLSQPAYLQINTEGATDAAARKKLEDAKRTPLIGVRQPDGSTDGATATRSTHMSKSASLPAASGYSGSQIFRTSPGKDPAEPDACGVVGGGSYWFVYAPAEAGTLLLNTEGSTYDTVLAVFVDDGQNLGYASLLEVACDNDSGTDGQTSALSLPVTGGTPYYIMVDGVNGAYGRVSLHYRLDTMPTISAITAQTVPPNQSTAPILFTVTDHETEASNLVLTASCSNSGLLVEEDIMFGGDGTNRTVQITPEPGASGTDTITITVIDSVGGMNSTTFTVEVIPVSNPLDIASMTLPVAVVGVAYSEQLTATGGLPGYTWTFVSGSLAGLTLISDGSLRGLPTQSGTNLFTVRVTDAVSNSLDRTLSLLTLNPIRLEPASASNGVWRWQLVGRPEQAYVLEATTNLVAPLWEPVATNSTSDGVLILTDPAPGGVMKFYRAREQ